MTEREVFEENIPVVAEMAVYCKRMSKDQYEKFKTDALKSVHSESLEFMKKIFTVIEEVM